MKDLDKDLDFEFIGVPNIMLDIETLGGIPPLGNCTIPAPFQISAVHFVPEADGIRTGGNINEFINIETLPDIFEFGSKTILWHIGQGNSENISKCANGPTEENVSAEEAMEIVDSFISSRYFVWAKGTDFDIPILRILATETGYSLPWEFYNVKDLRSFKPLPYVKNEEPHDGLEDCIAQIKQLEKKLYDE